MVSLFVGDSKTKYYNRNMQMDLYTQTKCEEALASDDASRMLDMVGVLFEIGDRGELMDKLLDKAHAILRIPQHV